MSTDSYDTPRSTSDEWSCVGTPWYTSEGKSTLVGDSHARRRDATAAIPDEKANVGAIGSGRSPSGRSGMRGIAIISSLPIASSSSLRVGLHDRE